MFVKRVIILVFLLSGCAHHSGKRIPASETALGCLDLGKAFNDEDLLKPPLKFSELPKRDLKELAEIEPYRKLANMNYHRENQRKSYYIISLLRERFPTDSVDEILEKYSYNPATGRLDLKDN